MTRSAQILGSYWTLAVGADPLGERLCSHGFRERVETAAKAGFTAMGFWHTDLRANRGKLGFPEMKRDPRCQRHQRDRSRVVAGLVLHR